LGRSTWIVGALLALAACGSDVENSTEYRALRDQRDTLSEQLADQESSLEQLNAQIADAESRAADADDLEQQLAASAAELAQAKKDLGAAGEAHDAFTEFASEAVYQWLGVSPSESDCLADGLVADQALRDAFWDMFSYSDPMSAGDEPPAVLDELFTDCGLDVTDFMSTYMDGNAYGDNPELDAMWDGCVAGDGTACDDLYFNSGVGTDYEAFGSTCGERFEDDRNAGMCYDTDLTTA